MLHGDDSGDCLASCPGGGDEFGIDSIHEPMPDAAYRAAHH